MGENLALNMLDNGWRVAAFNRTLSKVDDFVARAAAEGHSVCGCRSLEELVRQLETPRRVMFMIKSADPVPADEGLFPEISPVDSVIAQLCELLSPGDVIIDGGNTHFRDTERRQRFVEARGLLYIGTGVSGGEAGARRGPSIMPGGSDKAWALVRPIFETIAAKAGADGTEPCVDWIGPRGAGHYVKMVHNGIEYGNMQLIAEAYWLLKHLLKMGNEEIGQVFAAWNRRALQGYLMEITRDIFTVRDSETGDYLIDRILDRAGAKGTGKWTGQSSFDLGIPVTLITSAVNARNLSAQKELRIVAGSQLEGPQIQSPRNREAILKSLEIALHLSFLSSYAQGFAQLSEASRRYGYRLDLSQIARVWRAGCIIRATFLDDIVGAFGTDPHLENLLLAPIFKVVANRSHRALREVVTLAIESGLPVPGLSAALAYYDSLRSPHLPANLVQAQRDYFGSHRYQRVDKPEGETFHTEWEKLRTVKPAAKTGKEYETI
jgi:6-phosphogluconate dehydrogenase